MNNGGKKCQKYGLVNGFFIELGAAMTALKLTTPFPEA